MDANKRYELQLLEEIRSTLTRTLLVNSRIYDYLRIENSTATYDAMITFTEESEERLASLSRALDEEESRRTSQKEIIKGEL